MPFISAQALTEVYPGEQGEVWQGEIGETLLRLLAQHEGQVNAIYLDPPFETGKDFALTRNGSALTDNLVAYRDKWSGDEYYAFMEPVLRGLYALLAETGSLFLHIDYRTAPRLRLMLDDIFGAGAFVNEIIWAYESGGRAKNHFSRKHDTIYYYRKTPKAPFYAHRVTIPRQDARHNHMKRGVDEQGRAFRSIRTNGKEYRYYEDEGIVPGDVWTDISHLQQKDPERTGYRTQKPLKLLERILRCCTAPGDLVLDAFAGSGTTLHAARLNGCRFIGVDRADAAIFTMRRRLQSGGLCIHHEGTKAFSPPFEMLPQGGGVRLVGPTVPAYWAVGRLQGSQLHLEQDAFKPQLGGTLSLPQTNPKDMGILAVWENAETAFWTWEDT